MHYPKLSQKENATLVAILSAETVRFHSVVLLFAIFMPLIHDLDTGTKACACTQTCESMSRRIRMSELLSKVRLQFETRLYGPSAMELAPPCT